jgi:hypothetical protein
MKNKVKKESDGATRASVKKEMAKPRMAKSAREAEANLVAARIAHPTPAVSAMASARQNVTRTAKVGKEGIAGSVLCPKNLSHYRGSSQDLGTLREQNLSERP